jgi:hypothetical protein
MLPFGVPATFGEPEVIKEVACLGGNEPTLNRDIDHSSDGSTLSALDIF